MRAVSSWGVSFRIVSPIVQSLLNKWQQLGKSASACTARRRLFGQCLGIKKGSKKATLQKYIMQKKAFCRKYRDWTAEDGSKLFSLITPLPTVWDIWNISCPDKKRWTWIKNGVKTPSKSNLSQRSRPNLVICFFQHDGAQFHKGKIVTKWLRDHNIEILDLWPGNSEDFNLFLSILKKWVDKQKPTNSSGNNGSPSISVWPKGWYQACQSELKK